MQIDPRRSPHPTAYISLTVMRILPTILLLTACLPAGDPAQVGYNPRLRTLRADIIGCYEAAQMPERDAAPVDLRPMLRVFELDSTPRLSDPEVRRVFLSPSDVMRAHRIALPDGFYRRNAAWSADSRTDSITITVPVEMNALFARVSRNADGSLKGYLRAAWEGVVVPPQTSKSLQKTWSEPVEWRRIPCSSLRLDRG